MVISLKLVIVLTKPAQLTDFQFDDRVEKINELVFSMKTLLESKILNFFMLNSVLKCKFCNSN